MAQPMKVTDEMFAPIVERIADQVSTSLEAH
jgi:hypothetical protein